LINIIILKREASSIYIDVLLSSITDNTLLDLVIYITVTAYPSQAPGFIPGLWWGCPSLVYGGTAPSDFSIIYIPIQR
jgi:hypothetical protein